MEYSIGLDIPLKHDDDEFIWFHPRATAVPGKGKDGLPAVVMTLQKHLQADDHYSELYFMRSDDLGKTWTGPDTCPELAWRDGEGDTTIAVCDVTPAWHEETGKVLALGAQIVYNKQGEQLRKIFRTIQTAYSIHDPDQNTWSNWQIIDMPPDNKYDICRNACGQWLIEPDGTMVVPIYHTASEELPYSVTVIRCRCDGERIEYVEEGNTLEIDVLRGLCEPSLIKVGGRYYLTLRNDVKGYVSVSDDGLQYAPIKPWTFDDGTEPGSYNTQQHWVSHEEELFLVYTRRGADNDHVMRHRAPLFIAEVDLEKLCVIRDTEQVLVPERGAQLGNFGAAAITPNESWVTVCEGMWGEARERGGEGALFIARIKWGFVSREALDGVPSCASHRDATTGHVPSVVAALCDSASLEVLGSGIPSPLEGEG